MPGLFEREPMKAYKERTLTDKEAKDLQKPLTAKELGQEMASVQPPDIREAPQSMQEKTMVVKKRGLTNR